VSETKAEHTTLKLELNAACFDKSPQFRLPGGGTFIMTPPVGEQDYWLYRVQLTNEQSVIGFPKFGTVGIGFAKETDWNTNLPSRCEATEIFNHIKHNKGDDSIPDADCVLAIEMIREAVKAGGQ
jgi:hypothetical protein